MQSPKKNNGNNKLIRKYPKKIVNIKKQKKVVVALKKIKSII